MDYEVLAWPPGGPSLRLDHERFAYAGKFVMTGTGKAVARDDNSIVGAVAFDEDRTIPSTLRIRYVTVERTRRGEGIGSWLLKELRSDALERDYERVAIAVNNPYAYEACWRAGFSPTGETTGIAEVVLEHEPPVVRDPATYREGLRSLCDRESLSEAERRFLETRLACGPDHNRS